MLHCAGLTDGDRSPVRLQVGGLHPGTHHRLGLRSVHGQDQGHLKRRVEGTGHRERSDGDRRHLGDDRVRSRGVQGQGPLENQV